MVETFCRYILWLEPVDENERRVKRLTLNRPPRRELRVKMSKTSTAGASPSLSTGERKVLKRMNVVQSMKHEAATKKLSLPTILKRTSLFGQQTSLATLHHTIRSIDYEISVFGRTDATAFRLLFIAKDNERERSFQLSISLVRAVHALTNSEAATLVADNHDELHLEGIAGSPPSMKKMRSIYTSMDAIRLYVDALDIVRDKTNANALRGSTGGTTPGGSSNGLMLIIV